MKKLDIKPLSANQSFKGIKRRTHLYKSYEKKLLTLLANEKTTLKKGEKLELIIHFFYSSAASDVDNGLKPFIDVLATAGKGKWNDNQIYSIQANKWLVNKGDEGILFELKPFVQKVPTFFDEHGIKLR